MTGTAARQPPDLPGDDELRLLQARAQVLAQPPAADGEAGEASLDVLMFSLSGERYAVESAHVLAVHALRNLTPLPCTPDFIAGVVNVRGQLVTVVDLKKFFGLPDEGLTDLHRVVRVGDQAIEFGVLADMDLGLARVPLADLAPPLPTLTGIGAQYVRGITPDSLIVLDLPAILGDARLTVDETA